MQNENNSSSGKARYCVLYTQVLKQWKVSEAIRRALPGGEGEVFYPCRELWWHGRGETVFRPLFPGYVFIRSEMNRVELHALVLQARREILSFVKELPASMRKAVGEDAFSDEPGVVDLTDTEAEFFDFLLGFRFDAELDRRREEAAEEGRLYKPAPAYGRAGQAAEDTDTDTDAAADLNEEEKAMAAELRRREKQIPQKGIVQMSFGYIEGGRYIVMDGPLKGHEDRIKDYIAKDRKACLDIGVGGKAAKVGLTLLGKKIWFPKDKNSPDILPDGTVLDTRELARIMNGGGIRNNRGRKGNLP